MSEKRSIIDVWFEHLTQELGREPTEAEFADRVLADGKTCKEPIWERNKSRRDMKKCGAPAVGWACCLLAGIYPVCEKCSHFVIERFRPADFEPGFYEDM